MMYTVPIANTFWSSATIRLTGAFEGNIYSSSDKSALIFLNEYHGFQHNPLGCTVRNVCIDDQYSDQ